MQAMHAMTSAALGSSIACRATDQLWHCVWLAELIAERRYQGRKLFNSPGGYSSGRRRLTSCFKTVWGP